MQEPPVLPQQELTIGAGFGIRFLARLVDVVVSLAYGFVAGIFGVMVLVILQQLGRTSPGWQQHVGDRDYSSILYSILGSFLYFAITEGMHGASLGKLICGLRVISMDGTPCTFSKAFKRGLLYFWDALFFGLVGYTSMKKSSMNQRYGDVWADTIVVAKKHLPARAANPVWKFVIAYLLGVVLWMFCIGTHLVVKVI